MTRPTAASSWWKLGSFAGWKAVLLGNLGSPNEDSALDQLGGNAGDYSGDLRRLLVVIERVRRRLLANRFLGGWMVWLSWALLVLIAAAAFSRQLKYVLIVAASIVLAGVIVSLLREWWRRPSAYSCAREIDRATGLSDRLSTALYFGAAANSDPMILRQRRDALNQIDRVEPRALFPIQIPEFANRTAVLALVAMVLLAYRLYYSPPVMALLHRAAASHVAKAVLSPLAGAVKKELLAVVNRDDSEVKEAAPDAEAVAGLADPKNADDASQLGDKDGSASSDTQDDSQTATEGSEGDPQGENQNGAQPQGQDASQAGNASQDQQMADANQPPSGQNGENGSSQQPQTGGQSSSSSSMMQALKNLMKNMTGQPTSSDSNGQSSAAGSSQQPGSSSGQGEAKSDTPKDGSEQKELGSSSSSQKPGGGAGNGSTPVPKQAGKDAPPPPKNATPDRVNLEANDFRQQGRTRTTSAAGIAQLPLRDIKPQPVAAIKGAEQENIPVRYRLYVQRYFERTDKARE